MHAFSERLRTVMVANGIKSIEHIAVMGETTPAHIERWMHPAAGPVSFLAIERIAFRFGFRAHWLATGRGVPRMFSRLEEQERDLIAMATHMDDATLRAWLAIGRKLIEH